MRLAAKFNLVISLVLLIGFAGTGAVSYETLRRNAEREVLQTAGLMMEAALAVRGYTIEEIRPLLAPQMADVFHPQSVPAYAATQALDKLRGTHGEYFYKEATLNPTNPRDQATGWEVQIVQQFRTGDTRGELVGVRNTLLGESLYIARPIRISNPACLACHSTPEAAPRSMLVKYGTQRGFGWQLDEIVGAQIVSVPMSVPLQNARDAFVVFMGSLLAIFVAILIALNVILHKLVIKRIRQVATIADALSKGDREAPDFDIRGKDEVAVMANSFRRMRNSLERAIKLLGKR